MKNGFFMHEGSKEKVGSFSHTFLYILFLLTWSNT